MKATICNCNIKLPKVLCWQGKQSTSPPWWQRGNCESSMQILHTLQIIFMSNVIKCIDHHWRQHQCFCSCLPSSELWVVLRVQALETFFFFHDNWSLTLKCLKNSLKSCLTLCGVYICPALIHWTDSLCLLQVHSQEFLGTFDQKLS